MNYQQHEQRRQAMNDLRAALTEMLPKTTPTEALDNFMRKLDDYLDVVVEQGKDDVYDRVKERGDYYREPY